MKKKWESFAEVAFHAMKGVLPLWTNASPDTRRAMTRILYDLVFSTGDPNKTGYMSSNAMEAKTKRLKTCKDHCLSPQFVARMVYDNPDVWLTDFEKFKKLFHACCQTILITSKQNYALSNLTKNLNGEFFVEVATHEKYKHLNIKLFREQEGYVEDVFYDKLVPIELTKYERKYLRQICPFYDSIFQVYC